MYPEYTNNVARVQHQRRIHSLNRIDRSPLLAVRTHAPVYVHRSSKAKQTRILPDYRPPLRGPCILLHRPENRNGGKANAQRV